MNPARRRWLLALGQAPLGGLGAPVRAHAQAQAGQQPRSGAGADGGETDPVRRGREWVFPRDHGAHLGARIEWWYATGWLGSEDAPHLGFQLTFFRSRTALAEGNPSRFAPRQLLMAHAALVDLRAGRHAHDQRIVRWSGAADAGGGRASVSDAHIEIGNWWLRRDAAQWRASLPAAGFDLQLSLKPSQPLLLQGDAGFSRKGPGPEQASHYYSEPQLRATATWAAGRATQPVQGRAWLDHEWSDQILHPQAVGWDWAGINFFDGSALTVFALRRADGSALWSGGSFRAPGAAAHSFSPFHMVHR